MDLLTRLTADTPRGAKWVRRAITIPGLIVLWLVDIVALPFVLICAPVVDLARGRAFASTRFHLAVAFALSMHVFGLLVLVGATFVGSFAGRTRERDLDFRGEVWWATATWRAAARLYGMRVIVDGEEAFDGGGPVIIMSRHASLLDVLLPLVFASARHGLVPRYVAKRELLWDPCVDLAGHRIATAFVRRGSLEHDVDVAAVESLADDLGPHDAVVIFPEGTRFSEEKRGHLAALARKDEAEFARAARLKHVLPPHARGPLGVLDRARGADVVFCAHTGLEGARHLRDLLAGSLIGATVRVRYWRVSARDVPRGTEERIEWLWHWWECIDGWIEAHHAGSPPSSDAPLTPFPASPAER